jgi:hypothetical protein
VPAELIQLKALIINYLTFTYANLMHGDLPGPGNKLPENGTVSARFIKVPSAYPKYGYVQS